MISDRSYSSTVVLLFYAIKNTLMRHWDRPYCPKYSLVKCTKCWFICSWIVWVVWVVFDLKLASSCYRKLLSHFLKWNYIFVTSFFCEDYVFRGDKERHRQGREVRKYWETDSRIVGLFRCCCRSTKGQAACTPSKPWRRETLLRGTKWKGNSLLWDSAWRPQPRVSATWQSSFTS